MTDCKDDTQIIEPEDIAELFNQCAHGNAEHRLWLKDKFERFFNFPLPADLVAEALKEPEGRHAL